MLRIVVLLIAGLVVITPGSASFASELELVKKQLEATTAERDALRIELAQAKLKISELEAKLRSLPSPSQESAAPVGETASVDPAASQITTTPTGLSPVTVSNRVTHVVKILSIQKEQTDHLRDDLFKLNDQLRSASTSLGNAKRRRDSLKRDWLAKPHLSRLSVDQAEADVRQSEAQVSALQGQVNRLNAQIQEASQTRIMTGQDEVGGEHLRIVAIGPVASVLAGVQIGQRYTVEGIARNVGGSKEILLQTLRAE
jgi:multidrug resistance efflux pump